MRRMMIALCASLLWSDAISAPLIQCETEGKTPIMITLNAMRMFSKTLNCIRADFLVDMTPCAPNGGFGLSAPTGTAGLIGVVMRWQDAADHHGGVVRNFLTESQIYFSGLSSDWEFDVNRTTGRAILTINEDEIEGMKKGKYMYDCKVATKKF
jgi:hypothetical protein